MNDYHKQVIEFTSGVGIRLPDSGAAEAVPDEIVGDRLIELQEVILTPDGKGFRNAYSHHPSSAITFNFDVSPALLKAKLHKHDYFELVFVACEQIEIQIETQLCAFHQWDVCILNRSTRHAEHFKPGDRLFYLVLSPAYLRDWPREDSMGIHQSPAFAKFLNKGLREMAQQNKDYIAFRHKQEATASPVHGLLCDMRREFEEKQRGYQLLVRGLLARLFGTLSNPAQYTTEYVDLGADEGFSLAFSAKQILDKTKRRMKISELTERLNYSGEHISRMFKRHYGYTIPAYNNLICMRQAATLLHSTGQSVHDICRQLGFVNRTHFYALFQKEYGTTPASYRKQQHANQHT